MNIICFSNIDWDFLKQRHQNLMEEFAKRDEIETIIFVETLGSRSIKINKEDFKRGIKKIKNILSKNKCSTNDKKLKINEKIIILTPKFIPFFNKFTFEINKNILKKQLNKIKKLDNNETITWTMLQHPSILKLLNESNYKKNIFDCIDDIKSIPDVENIIVETEYELIKRSDLVFSTSKALYNYCKEINKNTYILKNAVNDKFIIENGYISDLKKIDSHKKIVGYVGTIYEWFDLEKIVELAKKRPDLDIILAGPIRIDVSELEKYENVSLLGKVSHDEVKEVILKSDVCIIPFILNDLIMNTNPVKVYEYFSMGKAVVASEIPELFEFKDLLYLYKDNFLECIDMALNEKNCKEKKLKRIEVARNNTWKSRVDEALKLI